MASTWKDARTTEHLGTIYPISGGFTRVFRNLKPHWSLCLALNNRDAVADSVSDNEIDNLQKDEITATQFTVDDKIEQSQIPEIAREFEPGANGPDLPWKQRAFLANKPAFVPRTTLRLDDVALDFGHAFFSVRPSTPDVSTLLTARSYRKTECPVSGHRRVQRCCIAASRLRALNDLVP